MPKTKKGRIHTVKFERTKKAIAGSLKKSGKKGNAFAIAESKLGYKKSILKKHRRK